MELRAGYKQTEAGVIPDDWDVDSIVNLASITTGDKNTQDRIADGEYPFFVRSSTVERINSFSFEGEAVLTAGDGVGTGKIFHYINGKFDFHQRVYMVSNFGERLDGYFFYLHFSSNFYDRVMQMTAKSSVDSVRREMIADMRMPVPPKSEQRAIATALTDVDSLLAKIDQLIAKKRDLKQAAMQQLLTGQTRLPGFSPANPQFWESPVGMIPSDWKVSKLVDLVDPSRSIRYGIVQPGHYDPQGRFMIRGQDYSESKGWASPSDVFRVSPQIEERYRNARVITGDLIMTIVGYCGHVEMVPEWLDGANLTQTTVRIAILPNLASGTYCKFVLASPIGRNQVSAFMKGAAQPGLNCGDIDNFLLTVPSIQEQAAIATVLSDMDAEIAALEARRDKTRALKQGMMQALLTGRIRLVGAN